MLWRDLWRLPQAVEWERIGAARRVARYVRIVVDAETPGASVALMGEARQLEDKLGLTPKAMLQLRWEIDEPLPEVEDERKPAPVRRIRAVDPAAIA